MSSTETTGVSAEEFDRIAAGLRWSKRNLDVTRAVLVAGESVPAVAEAHSISPQQIRVLHNRFMARLREQRATKVTAAAYLAKLATLDLFKPALIKLRRSGLSDEQLLDYLRQNDMTATGEQLAALLADGKRSPSRSREKRHEVPRSRQSKGRRR